MERNFATMELTHYAIKSTPVGARHLEQLCLSNAFDRGLSSASICYASWRGNVKKPLRRGLPTRSTPNGSFSRNSAVSWLPTFFAAAYGGPVAKGRAPEGRTS